ncbi:MAG: M28 family peptidase [Bacteroidetes bacterium]|nr:M28 family peptidase [Bacteroidota bacterium]
MKMDSLRSLAALICFVLLVSCGNHSQQSEPAGTSSEMQPPKPVAIHFNADTAYGYVAAQVAFGPRTPGSKAQRACAEWMQQKLRSFCDTVYRQETTVTGGDKKKLPCINLIGSIHPKAKKRVLLLTHWDSRPWADEDTKDTNKPILAADDGASGVAVLLELARQLKAHPLPESFGIDIFFTDVEDYGRSEWGENSYCLGTQYWAQHPHLPGYKADYGILLDMVGGRGSRFPMEQTSSQYAPDVQQRVWQAAAHAGYSSYFPFQPSQGGVTDDHKFVNEMAHIPTIDIIALTNSTATGFAPHWHTHADNIQVIDRATLQAVGQTLLQALSEDSSTQ